MTVQLEKRDNTMNSIKATKTILTPRKIMIIFIGTGILSFGIHNIHCQTDITVLLLSLTYIPIQHMGYSIVTITVSSLLIDFVKNFGKQHDGDPKRRFRL